VLVEVTEVKSILSKYAIMFQHRAGTGLMLRCWHVMHVYREFLPYVRNHLYTMWSDKITLNIGPFELPHWGPLWSYEPGHGYVDVFPYKSFQGSLNVRIFFIIIH